MNKKKEKRQIFPIEKKLVTIEWNLQLLKASATVTHTPLRTLKSMVQASVVKPTHSMLREIINPPPPQRKTC